MMEYFILVLEELLEAYSWIWNHITITLSDWICEINLLVCIYVLHLPMCLLTAVEEYDTRCTPYSLSQSLSHTLCPKHKNSPSSATTCTCIYCCRLILSSCRTEADGKFSNIYNFAEIQSLVVGWGHSVSASQSDTHILSVINIHSNQRCLCTRYCIVL